jgi:hypothetical protein
VVFWRTESSRKRGCEDDSCDCGYCGVVAAEQVCQWGGKYLVCLEEERRQNQLRNASKLQDYL